MEKNQPPSYIIVGPRNSGKTVYFVTAVDLMQRLANDKNAGIAINHALPFDCVEYHDTKTRDFVDISLDNMFNMKWPDRTFTGNGNRFQILFHKRGLLNRTIHFSLLDYSGGTFTAAFSNEGELPPEEYVNCKEDIQKIKDDIKSAEGIFVMMDSSALYNGKDIVMAHCLFNLVDYYRVTRKRKSTRIGVIFSKRDIISDPSFCPKKRLRENFPNEWGKLMSIGVEFFTVSSVKNTEVDLSGEVVPVKGFRSSDSEGILKPLSWMFQNQIGPIRPRILLKYPITSLVNLAAKIGSVSMNLFCRIQLRKK